MKKIIRYIVMLVALCGLIFSLYKIINWKKDVDDNKDTQEKIQEYVQVEPEKDEFKIDFDELSKRNSDTIAYVYVPNTNINYVVVKGTDNAFYLNHNFDKKKNSGGWMFMDYSNTGSINDKNIVIYGHNMKDGSMLANLRRTMNKEWYENSDNHLITYINKSGTYKYKVFSQYITTEAEEYYINTSFESDSAFKEFVKSIKKRSYVNYDLDIDSVKSVLTFSTCSSIGNGRVVMHSALVNEE